MKVSINNLKGYAELEKILEIAEITLEYINTDDNIKIIRKVAQWDSINKKDSIFHYWHY